MVEILVEMIGTRGVEILVETRGASPLIAKLDATILLNANGQAGAADANPKMRMKSTPQTLTLINRLLMKRTMILKTWTIGTIDEDDDEDVDEAVAFTEA